MDKELVRIVKDKELCAIYDVEDVSMFSCGYILDIDDDYILLNCVDSCGYYDGIELIARNTISKVELKTEHIYNLLKLLPEDYKIPDCKYEQHPKITALKFAKANGKFIRVELRNSGYDDNLGLVKKYDDTMLYLEGYNSSGNKDGEAIIKLEFITKIRCDTRFGEKIAKLVKLKN